jgi:hypothetical protein
MATRCQIGIYKSINSELEEPESIIFKMHDGYVENTLPTLLNFVGEMDLIDKDISFKIVQDCQAIDSWLKYYLIQEFLNEIRPYVEEDPTMKCFYILKEIYSTGAFYQDIEFYYAFYPDRIESYEVGYDETGQVFHIVNICRFNYELLEPEKLMGMV